MKVSEFAKKMNDRGTNPRVKVLKYEGNYNLLVFEGSPDNMSDEVAKLKVNTFTVLGKGFIEVYAQ